RRLAPVHGRHRLGAEQPLHDQGGGDRPRHLHLYRQGRRSAREDERALRQARVAGAEGRKNRLAAGLYSRRSVDEYWIVDPVAQTIDVYRQQAGRLAHVAWLTREDTLTSPGLPGFTCAVAGLFDTRTMSPRSP